MKRKQALKERAYSQRTVRVSADKTGSYAFTKRFAICRRNAQRSRKNQLRRPTEFPQLLSYLLSTRLADVASALTDMG